MVQSDRRPWTGPGTRGAGPGATVTRGPPGGRGRARPAFERHRTGSVGVPGTRLYGGGRTGNGPISGHGLAPPLDSCHSEPDAAG
eukprot:7365-Hanusia_phi.AAC.1